MGNSLTCNGASNSSGLESAFCPGTVFNSSGCVFPFTLVLENGSSQVVNTCLSGNVLSPGLDSGLENNTFWCSLNETLSLTQPTGFVGSCGCSTGVNEEDMTWLLGVLFSILSSMATTIGMILQKVAHNINDRKPDEEKAYEWIGILFSPYWLCAFTLMVLLPLPFDFVALALASQSLLVPFAGLSLVLNQLIAPWILGEKLDRIEIIATGIIVAGLVISTVGGSKEDVSLNACELLERYTETDFLVACFTLGGSILLCLFLIHFFRSSSNMFLRLRPAFYAFCAGGFGGLGNVFFKATGELAEAGLRTTDASGGAWGTIHPYYHIILIIFFSVFQISYINQGLRQYDAVLYIPLYNCMYILLSGTMGAITYREFHRYTTLQTILFPSGVLLTLAGILIMTQKTPGIDQDLKVRPDETNSPSKAKATSPESTVQLV